MPLFIRKFYAMNINILREKTDLLQTEVLKWVQRSYPENSVDLAPYKYFLQSCCDIHIIYQMALRAFSKEGFSEGLLKVIDAAYRLEYWIRCCEALNPSTTGEMYGIKKQAEEIRALCFASIKTMHKKKNPAESY